MAKIDLKVIESKLPKIAFDLFRDWTQRAKVDYPAYDFTIKDERHLVKDLKLSVSSAIRNLYWNNTFKSGDYPIGWDIGFVLGFIQGKLNVSWTHEYIVKQSNDYKSLTALKAIQLYLKGNEVAMMQIDDFYHELLESDLNLMEPNFDIIKRSLDFNEQFKFKKSNKKGRTLTMLNNLLLTNTIRITNEEHRLYLEDLDHHISTEEIRALIDQNSAVFT